MSCEVLAGFIDLLVAEIAARVVVELGPKFREGVAAAFETRANGRLLTVTDLGKRLGKSPDATRMWLRRRGKPLAEKSLDVSGQRRWRAEDFEEFLSKPVRR